MAGGVGHRRVAGKAFIALATALVAGTVGLSGCGGSEPTTFTPEVQENFVNSCVDSATEGSSPATESDAERICGCMYDELKTRMSFEEFKAADDSLREGEQMSAELSATLKAAASACA
jgi:hypothetical protein